MKEFNRSIRVLLNGNWSNNTKLEYFSKLAKAQDKLDQLFQKCQ